MHIDKKILILTFLFSIAAFVPLPAIADGSSGFLPSSRHHPYENFGYFIDDQTTLVYRSAARAWGALGVHLAWFGTESGQLVMSGSVNTAFRLEDALSPETADARVSLVWESRFSSDWLYSAGYRHASGHVNDDVLDRSLVPLNVGIDLASFRLIYAGHSRLRPSLLLSPRLGSDPATHFFDASQALEVFPWGESASPRSPTPYFAFGLEEVSQQNWGVTKHVQAGVYFGNHLQAGGVPTVRLCAGYFIGPDPRLKYYYYQASQVSFAYAGLMINP